MTDSRGAGFGEGTRSERLQRSQRGDPRARRAAQANRTTDSLGDGLKRDGEGKQAVDVAALASDPAFIAALVANGFVRSTT